MAKYAIAFDLDTAAMRKSGMKNSDITKVYQTELPDALASCGFTAHPQGSLYHTEIDDEAITAVMQLQTALKQRAPNFCTWLRRAHVFRLEEWSDVTILLADRPAAPDPTAEEEIDQQDSIAAQ